MLKRILTTTIIILSLIFILGWFGISGLTYTSTAANPEINTKAELGSKWQMNQTEIEVGAGTESDGTNNAEAVTFSSTSLPDLVIEGITLSPTRPSIGDKVIFTVTIKNQGSGKAGSSHVYFYVDNARQNSASVNTIEPGATANITFAWTAQAGSHSIKAVADSEEEVVESDETNNDYTYVFSVLAPDLIIDTITWSPENPSVGDKVTFTVTIKNQGYITARFSQVDFHIDGASRGYQDVPRIDAGAAVTKTFTWITRAGSHEIKAIADSNNVVTESDETNNEKTVTFSTATPDLIIQTITWSPASPSVGDAVTFTVTIKNQGSGRAEYSLVAFYIDDARQNSASVNRIDADATANITFAWTAQAGSHAIKAVADSNNVVTESDETNNEKTVTFSTATPDLIIQTITWSPTSPSVGDTVTFRVTIKNQGSGIADSSRVAYYIEGSPAVYQDVQEINAGAAVTKSFTWTAEAGSHTIKAVADFREMVVESDETNNAKTVTFSTLPPDFIIQNITWSPANPSVGDTVIFTVTIGNQGSGRGDYSRVSCYVDDIYLSSASVDRIAPNGTDIETFTWTAQVGSHTIKAVADSGNAVAESDETNNAKTVAFTPSVPDLIIQSITWSPTDPSVGDTVLFTVTIKNQGSGKAGYFSVAYFIDGSSRGYQDVPWIDAGAAVTKTFTWTARAGSHEIKAIADSNNVVTESDENNNEKTANFPAPDLIIQTITWSPESPTESDNVTFTVTIKNQGSGRADYPSVACYIDDAYLASASVNETAPGATVTKTFNWFAQAGSHTFTAIADKESQIFEIDETNNEKTVTFSVSLPPAPTPAPALVPEPTPVTTPSPKPQEVNIHLDVQSTRVSVGQDIVLNLSADNLKTKTTMTVELTLEIPSGMTVTSTEFVKGDKGQYTASYSVEPGSIRQTEVHIRANQEGSFIITGQLAHYFAWDKPTAEYQTLSLPVTVKTAEAQAEKPTPALLPKEVIWPGWWFILVVVVVLGSIVTIVTIATIATLQPR